MGRGLNQKRHILGTCLVEPNVATLLNVPIEYITGRGTGGGGGGGGGGQKDTCTCLVEPKVASPWSYNL